jgi:hypothetical protein
LSPVPNTLVSVQHINLANPEHIYLQFVHTNDKICPCSKGVSQKGRKSFFQEDRITRKIAKPEVST